MYVLSPLFLSELEVALRVTPNLGEKSGACTSDCLKISAGDKRVCGDAL